MKKIISLVLSLLLAGSFYTAVSQEVTDNQAADEEITYTPMDLWGVGVKASTDGIGFELIKGFGQRLNIRLGYSTLNIPISYDLELEGFDLNAAADLRFRGVNLVLDYYLVKNLIHLTGGMVFNNMSHAVQITPLSEFPYGDIMVPPSDIGQISATLTPGTRFSPYAALGFGNTLSRKHRVSFNFELGAMYHGSPQLGLEGSGIIGPIASESNQQVIMDAIAQYQWFPMVSLQLSFRII